jgi:hypothetical protein
MAITTRTIVDGPRHAVIYAHIVADGTPADFTDSVIVDASALSPAPTKCVIETLEYNISGFQAVLEFDATSDDIAWHLDSGADYKDFREYGGIVDPGASGSTGDITITTSGIDAAEDEGTIVIKVRKKF